MNKNQTQLLLIKLGILQMQINYTIYTNTFFVSNDTW